MCGIFVAFNKKGFSSEQIKNYGLATNCIRHRGQCSQNRKKA